jgi:hypothetical protein
MSAAAPLTFQLKGNGDTTSTAADFRRENAGAGAGQSSSTN